MKINHDDTGKILSFGLSSDFQGIEYTHTLPNDFKQTFSLGKYRMNPDTLLIEKVEGWVAPDGFVPVVIPPNWDMLYGRLLAGDLKPIFESIKAIAKTDPAITWDLTALATAIAQIRTEQALKDCLDELIADGYVVSDEHKLLWNNAIAELNFSDLVRLV